MRAASEVYKARPWPEFGVVKLYGALGSRTVDLQTYPKLSDAPTKCRSQALTGSVLESPKPLGNAQTSAKIN
jgi:hypothetical protein